MFFKKKKKKPPLPELYEEAEISQANIRHGSGSVTSCLTMSRSPTTLNYVVCYYLRSFSSAKTLERALCRMAAK